MKLYSIIAGAVLIVFAATSYAGEIKKVKDGYTVEELFTKRDELHGKKVSVRGKVIKFNAGIMGKNWAHLEDGSGKSGTNDITVTTIHKTTAGAVVVATGILSLNKNFGGGYVYDVIIEDATLVNE